MGGMAVHEKKGVVRMSEREKLITQLESLRFYLTKYDRDFFDTAVDKKAAAKAIANAIALLNDKETAAEMEGGGANWFFVCGECRGLLGTNDKYCRNCGRKVVWK